MTEKTPAPKFGQDSRITRITARSGESTIGIVRSDDDPAEIGVVVHEQFPALGIDHLTTVIVDAADLRAALDEHTPAAEPLAAQEPTDGEVLAALNAQGVVVSPKMHPAPSLDHWGDKPAEAMRAALSAARAARRDEEKR